VDVQLKWAFSFHFGNIIYQYSSSENSTLLNVLDLIGLVRKDKSAKIGWSTLHQYIDIQIIKY